MSSSSLLRKSHIADVGTVSSQKSDNDSPGGCVASTLPIVVKAGAATTVM
jgi:hypothetical protein